MKRIRKHFSEILKDVEFKVNIKTNLKIFDSLDIIFSLSYDTYKPYKESNDVLLHNNASSSHPLHDIKQLLHKLGKKFQLIHQKRIFSIKLNWNMKSFER